MKQLEELLNLAPDEEEPEVEVNMDDVKSDIEEYNEIIETTDKIDAALPVVLDIDENDREMDELAKLATQAYTDLMDLGMNVDNSARIFEVASSFLGHAITAKNSKASARQKIIDLQLKKAKLDQTDAKKPKGFIGAPEEGKGQIINRSDFLREIIEQKNNE